MPVSFKVLARHAFGKQTRTQTHTHRHEGAHGFCAFTWLAFNSRLFFLFASNRESTKKPTHTFCPVGHSSVSTPLTSYPLEKHLHHLELNYDCDKIANKIKQAWFCLELEVFAALADPVTAEKLRLFFLFFFLVCECSSLPPPFSFVRPLKPFSAIAAAAAGSHFVLPCHSRTVCCGASA